MKALAETFPVPGHTNGRGLDPFRTRGDTKPDQHLAGEPGKNRTTFHQFFIGTVTNPLKKIFF
jgi:hypothetical protein